ncbi:unnamed protein product [Callosobruchus maculatus]|uniref:Pentraxin (PTX) domain-containing protein n=1 Tax=Callosobruchus maculatus TaxID=64391 RepID=A0A653D1C0_CALMS|nr:unnamed protein product [Callosobruchus maculatus]
MSLCGGVLTRLATLVAWCILRAGADDWHPFQPGPSEYFGRSQLGHEPNLILDHGYGHHGGISVAGGDHHHHEVGSAGNQCEVYKVGFTQDLYFQYVQYKTDVPDMKEFTLCFWTKFYNHSNDHPVFSYAVDGQPKAILSAVSNTDRSSYFTMAVAGHTFYRLNYPLRLNKWYHTCQSWNGKTGEWQIWVNAERVGRGFHNRLVGHTIPGGGIAITGQEQAQLGGGFQEGKGAPKGSGGMLGEITMLQLYSVALTAGKAHKDHKHHHAHQYDHEGRIITTPAPTTPRARPQVAMHPLLTGGQINRRLRINLAQPETVAGQNYDVQFLNGQFVVNHVAQQFAPKRRVDPAMGGQQQQQQQAVGVAGNEQAISDEVPPGPAGSDDEESGSEEGRSFSSQFFTLGDTSLVNTDFNHVQPDSSIESHDIFRRDNADMEAQPSEKKVAKREFVIGGTIVESPISSHHLTFEQSLLDGLAGIGQNTEISQKQKQAEEEREPAEAEVKAVLNICDGCDEEPFERALIFGWRTVPKKLYSGAFYKPAKPQCKVF